MSCRGAAQSINRPIVIAVLGCLAAVLAGPPHTEAVIVCEKGKKIRIRPGPECKKKEQKTLDLGTLASGAAIEAFETGVAGRLGIIENEVGLRCHGAPTRTVAPAGVGCAAFDGDAAACEGRFQGDRNLPASCFHFGSRCYACESYPEESGGCTNVCLPPTCPGDPTRGFVGRPARASGADPCGAPNAQSLCEASFGVRGTGEPVSCQWELGSSECRGCVPEWQRAGACSNACGGVLRTCASRAGAPVADCVGLGEAACGTSWIEGNPYIMPCYWHAATSACRTCTPRAQFKLKECSNDC